MSRKSYKRPGLSAKSTFQVTQPENKWAREGNTQISKIITTTFLFSLWETNSERPELDLFVFIPTKEEVQR